MGNACSIIYSSDQNLCKQCLRDELNIGATYYARDANGEVMAVYKSDLAAEGCTTPLPSWPLSLVHWNLYGSGGQGRLGTRIPNEPLLYSEQDVTTNTYARKIGETRYELKDHLGNVRVVVSDVKEPDAQNPGHFLANVLSVNDYYPFGMLKPTRFAAAEYRYGFNGMEQDGELKGIGNSYDYGARFYDPRVARWLSLDPMFMKYESLSGYHFGYNNPIVTIDPNGKENVVVAGKDQSNKSTDNFIQSAFLQIDKFKDAQPDEKTTLVLFESENTEEYNDRVRTEVTKKYGDNIEVITFSTDDELTNYMNSKNINDSKVSKERKEDKITDLVIFGHGFKGSYEPNFGGELYEDNLSSSWGIDDVKNLSNKAFENAEIIFYTCNAATEISETSLTKETAISTQSIVTGWRGKTSYENIFDTQMSSIGRLFYRISSILHTSRSGTLNPLPPMEQKKTIESSDRLPEGSSDSQKERIYPSSKTQSVQGGK